MSDLPKMYAELARWWPLLSPVEDYAEEAEFYRQVLARACAREPRTLLELGSGGGNNASFLKQHFALTLVDPAEGMLAESRKLNPECEHVPGDMRTARLTEPGGELRQFDCVFVHDAVMYMVTRDDLRRAIETAFVHCAPGGAALFVPDSTGETFAPGTSHGGSDAADGRGLRFLEWCWDPDPADESYRVEYVITLREADGTVRVEHDRHVEGVYPRAVWLELLRAVGFEPEIVRTSELAEDGSEMELFVGWKRS